MANEPHVPAAKTPWRQRRHASATPHDTAAAESGSADAGLAIEPGRPECSGVGSCETPERCENARVLTPSEMPKPAFSRPTAASESKNFVRPHYNGAQTYCLQRV